MRRIAIAIFAAAVCLALGAGTAEANRTLLSQAVLKTATVPPNPAAQIEGPCGLALAPGGDIYVSDYYHRRVAVFSTSTGEYKSAIALPGSNPVFGLVDLDAVCGLARDSSGRLYANEWHQSALRLSPSELLFDSAESTGIAVDEAGDVYVDDRTYVAVYEPSGAPVKVGGEALKIGLGSLEEGYGLAVAAGKVYVPDAATDTVKVYEPAGNPAVPVATISAGFKSLTDAAVAVDPSNGHLLVVDNSQPGFEHPKAAIDEFDSSGTFLGRLPGSPVDGEPSGLAVDSAGTLYVTDGNSAGGNVFEYSSYVEPISSQAPAAAAAGPVAGAAAGQPASPAAAASAQAAPRAHASRGGAALAQKGPIRVALSGGLAPTRLPRSGTAPISVTVAGHISSSDPENPPQLRTVTFAFNRAGRLDTRGLPRCGLTDIDPSSTAQALAACRDALVGEGRFSANVRLPEQSPFPSAGKVLAFNGTLKGRPVIFAHIYGTQPVPTSIVLPLSVRHGKGTFSTVLETSLASLTGNWGYVTGISLRLGRKYSAGGQRHSFLSAGCPAPAGFPGAIFPLARASFSFLGGRTLSATLTRNCTVRH